MSRAGIGRRVRSGRLHRVHRGVFAVGHPGLGRRGRWKAATLAYAPHGFLSHRSAAELWGMLSEADGPVHVTIAGRSGRQPRDGIVVHRPRTLPPRARLLREGIPVASPALTVADLRRTEPPATGSRGRR